MHSLENALRPILSKPTPEALVELQGALLASGQQAEAVRRSLDVAGQFYAYLAELQSKISAKQYSELASHLDIGAVGAVAFEDVLFGNKEHFWKRLILGGVAEGLMVAASRQYVKAWTVETELVHTQAAWYLSEALWNTSLHMQPELEASERWRAIESLIAPVHDADTPAEQKAVLLGRIYQILLLIHLSRLLPDKQESKR